MGKKSARLGQNFLIDDRFAKRIVSALPSTDRSVLEIGPGKGILTEYLMKGHTADVHAVEIDRNLAENLRQKWPRLNIHVGDVLETDPKDLGISTPFLLISNLPYDISRPFFDRLIEWIDIVTQSVIMVQKEFADKMVLQEKRAAQGNMLATLYHIERLFNVPPGAFRPSPKIISSVLRLTPVSAPMSASDRPRYYHFLKSCFGSPRKTLYNNLRDVWPTPLEPAFASCSIKPNARPDELSSTELHTLWAELKNNLPSSVKV